MLSTTTTLLVAGGILAAMLMYYRSRKPDSDTVESTTPPTARMCVTLRRGKVELEWKKLSPAEQKRYNFILFAPNNAYWAFDEWSPTLYVASGAFILIPSPVSLEVYKVIDPVMFLKQLQTNFPELSLNVHTTNTYVLQPNVPSGVALDGAFYSAIRDDNLLNSCERATSIPVPQLPGLFNVFCGRKSVGVADGDCDTD